jgi:hypothetical protein
MFGEYVYLDEDVLSTFPVDPSPKYVISQVQTHEPERIITLVN